MVANNAAIQCALFHRGSRILAAVLSTRDLAEEFTKAQPEPGKRSTTIADTRPWRSINILHGWRGFLGSSWTGCPEKVESHARYRGAVTSHAHSNDRFRLPDAPAQSRGKPYKEKTASLLSHQNPDPPGDTQVRVTKSDWYYAQYAMIVGHSIRYHAGALGPESVRDDSCRYTPPRSILSPQRSRTKPEDGVIRQVRHAGTLRTVRFADFGGFQIA
ncbi:hypothetical protein NM688_g5295 [Phlebia brevispora]|uniref:Uncharacterized protein n=1 Tax=Phlebia brevispora TaxID=194682 RepID=A0ACC1SXG2_9APHY|nr:hypothetical protein NM688_g5295 [Phlebia brevispora]